MLELTKIPENHRLGSQKVGLKYAEFYNIKIGEMLKGETANPHILYELQHKVGKDCDEVSIDRSAREGRATITTKQVRENDFRFYSYFANPRADNARARFLA